MGKKNLIFDLFQSYGVKFTEEQLEKFSLYLEELKYYNSKFNLTAHTEDEDIIKENFLDSLSCLEAGVDFRGKKMIDLGTGAGFPGIPIRIILKEGEVHLLEATGKKVDFLEIIRKKLNLEKTFLHYGRIEEFAHKKDFRETFDLAFARGLANLPVLLEYGLPFLKKGGIFIVQKGKKYQEEIDLSSNALSILGGNIENIKSVGFPGESKKLILIKKNGETPGKYPRRPGIPKKRPL